MHLFPHFVWLYLVIGGAFMMFITNVYKPEFIRTGSAAKRVVREFLFYFLLVLTWPGGMYKMLQAYSHHKE